MKINYADTGASFRPVLH